MDNKWQDVEADNTDKTLVEDFEKIVTEAKENNPSK